MTSIEPAGTRLLPQLTAANRDFWTGGAGGQLLVPRCESCRRWVLPPQPSCPACDGPLRSEPVSGRGTVYSWTLNQQQFHPDIPPPNLIAIVLLDEQEDLRLATNLVRVDPDAVSIGLAVRVLFEPQGEIFYPVFEPEAAT